MSFHFQKIDKATECNSAETNSSSVSELESELYDFQVQTNEKLSQIDLVKSSEDVELSKHLNMEIEEIIYNTSRKNQFILKFDSKFKKNLTPKGRLDEAFKVMKLSKHLNSVNISVKSEDLYLLTIDSRHCQQFLEDLKRNRKFEANFKITPNISKETRRKKFLLGIIQTKINQQRHLTGETACVMRFSSRAILVTQKNSNAKKKYLPFHEVMKTQKYFDMLCEEDKKNVLKDCSDISRTKLTLLL